MAVKKSELYSTLWKSCDKLRGGMDASQYKDYVLVLLFMKYVSDRSKNAKNSLLEIPEGGGFADLVKLKGKANIGEGINTVISALADANDLRGVIDVADFNDDSKLGKGKEMVDRLSDPHPRRVQHDRRRPRGLPDVEVGPVNASPPRRNSGSPPAGRTRSWNQALSSGQYADGMWTKLDGT